MLKEKVQRKAQRYKLKPEIKEALLGSQELLGKVADMSVKKNGKALKANAIKTRIEKNSPSLLHLESIAIIKEALNLPEEEIIYEVMND